MSKTKEWASQPSCNNCFLHLHHLTDESIDSDDSVSYDSCCCDDDSHAGNPVNVPLSDCQQKQ